MEGHVSVSPSMTGSHGTWRAMLLIIVVAAHIVHFVSSGDILSRWLGGGVLSMTTCFERSRKGM
jgi:hypothetical protein